jgi:rare lipoprotein A
MPGYRCLTLAAALVAAFSLPAEAAECGGASFYAYTGNKTASGAYFTGAGMTAAHRSLPFGTLVRVIDQLTGAYVDVTVNDRGPFVRGRIIDLSRHAAERLGIVPRGVALVCLEIL